MNIFYSPFLSQWIAFNGSNVAFGDTMHDALASCLSKIMA